jgi:hypothetical protein
MRTCRVVKFVELCTERQLSQLPHPCILQIYLDDCAAKWDRLAAKSCGISLSYLVSMRDLDSFSDRLAQHVHAKDEIDWYSSM